MMPHRKSLGVEDSTAALANILDSFDIARISLDARGRIYFMNRLAESLLRTSDALSIRHGRIRCASARATAKLDTVLMVARTQASYGLSRASIAVPYDHRSMYVTALPIGNRGRLQPSRAKVLLTITDAKARPKSREHILSELFRLTPAEIRVAMLLLAGLVPKQICRHTGSSQHTVRFQLKAIYRKTGTVRQSQLVRLISMLPGQLEGVHTVGNLPFG